MDSLITHLQTKDITLRPHQIQGIQWMLDIEKSGTGAILADDPGLGKTLQLASLIYANPSPLPTLIAVPTSILQQWSTLLETIFPFQVYIHYGDTLLDSPQALSIRQFKIALTTPTMLRLTLPTLRSIHWNRVVLDEAHIIKNPKSALFEAFVSLKANFFWALTGTPIHNCINDIRSIFNFVLNKPITKTQVYSLINTHMLRRDKSILNLPNIQINDQIITLNEDDEERCHAHIVGLCKILKRKITTLPSQEHIIWAIVTLMRIRIYITNFKISHILQHIHNNPHTIVFYHYQKELDNILQHLPKHLTTGFINGSVPLHTRVDTISARPNVLFIQLKAGGVGLNLQMYTSAIITSPDWNPANEIQAIARIHRLGQNSTTSYTRLILQSIDYQTPDIYIQSIFNSKNFLYALVNQNVFPPSQLTQRLLLKLLMSYIHPKPKPTPTP